MDHDRNMIRIFEGGCAAIEGRIVELPFRRSDLPNQLGKIAPVFFVAKLAAFRGEIELVPPLQLPDGGHRSGSNSEKTAPGMVELLGHGYLLRLERRRQYTDREWPALRRRGFIFQTALIFAGTAALRAAGVPE
jgi:hypothetical protein